MHRYALALGSNRRHGRHGAPARVVAAAIADIARFAPPIACSAVIETAALGPAGRRFANAALVVATSLPPPELLARLKAMERTYGRRSGRRWGARVLDLDILLWSGGRWRGARPALSIPHMALAGRGFVLDPLTQIAGGWRVADSGCSVRHLHARLHRRRPLRLMPLHR